MNVNRLLSFALCLALCGCEGATYVRHHFENGTSDTVELVFRAQDSWVDSTVLVIPPTESSTVWTLDQRGKCHQCGIYYSPYSLMDSLVLIDGLWLDYPGPEDWHLETDEGRSWFEFNHRLLIDPNMLVQ